MRCPKCHYISFGSVTRCRNCGYELSLAPDPQQPADLPMHSPDAPVGPLRDLSLAPGRAPASAESSRAGSSGPSLDLPLFTDRDPLDDKPLISAPASPRAPLSVRRAPPPPSPPKPRFERSAAAPMLDIDDQDDTREQPADEDADDERRRDEELRARRASLQARADRGASADADFAVAPTWLRLVAGVVDVCIIAGIDAVVLLSTLRVLGLDVEQVLLLPVTPIALFLVLLNGGYLATFTAAGGQTIGKMVAGIRVIAERPGPPSGDDGAFDRYTPRVSLGAAVLRATAYLASLLPAGLGFAAILLDKDGRALHDRLAETRVVRA